MDNYKKYIKFIIADKFVKKYHFKEFHFIDIPTSKVIVWDELLNINLRSNLFISFFISLRTLFIKNKDESLKSIFNLRKMDNFIKLGSIDYQEISLGMAGKFWKLNGGIIKSNINQFSYLKEKDFAKLIWSFKLEEFDGNTILYTETRVWCSSIKARLYFSIYWFFIYLISTYIRLYILKNVKKNAMRRVFN